MLRNQSFIPLATVFIVWLCVFSTYGNAASLDDDKGNTQSAVAASTSGFPAGPGNFPGFPSGGGGNSNGGGGGMRIWTPFGWISIGGGGNRPGGGGGGRWFPFPKPNYSPVTPKPFKPKPCHPVTPKPVIPTPKPNPKPVIPTPKPKPKPKPVIPTPKPNPSPSPKPFKPNPCHPKHPSKPFMPNFPGFPSGGGSSRPIVPPWLTPFIGPHSSKPAHLPSVNSMETQSETGAVEASKTLAEGRHHYYQCWSVLEKVDKCVNEVLTAFSSRKFEVLSSSCCSAIEKMDKDCHARTIGNFHDHFFSASVHKHCSAN